jgi:hypothetical protein
MNIGDYLIIDFITLIVLLLATLIPGLLIYPGETTKTSLSIKNQIYIIEKTIPTLSIFTGIMLSFFILSFNLFFKYFGRFAFLSFFKNRKIKIFLTLVIFTITFLIHSAVCLNKTTENNTYTNFLFIVSLILSFITVFSIFPMIISLLAESQSRDNIQKVFNKYNTNWLISYHQNIIWSQKLSHKHYQKDPVSLLTEIGISAINQFDQITLQTIISEFIEYFKKSIDNKKNIIEPKDLIEEYRKLVNSLFPIAIKERNENAAVLLANKRLEFEVIIIKNLQRIKYFDHNEKYQGWSYNIDNSDFFRKSIEFNEIRVCRVIIDNQRDFTCEIIKSILPASNFEYDSLNPLLFFEEKNLITSALFELSYLCDSIIDQKKYTLFENIANAHITLDLATIDSNNTKNSKNYLLHILNEQKLNNFEKYISQNDIKIVPRLYYPFQISTSQALIEIKNKIPFLTSLRAMYLLFSYEKLNSIAINFIKADLLHIVKNIENSDFYSSLLSHSLNKIDELRTKISTKDNDYKKDIYIKLHRYLDIVYCEANEKTPQNVKVTLEIKSVMEKFTLIKKFETELEKKSYISSDDIVYYDTNDRR